MKLQNMICANYGSTLRKEGNMPVCDSCGSSFAIDCDESDSLRLIKGASSVRAALFMFTPFTHTASGDSTFVQIIH